MYFVFDGESKSSSKDNDTQKILFLRDRQEVQAFHARYRKRALPHERRGEEVDWARVADDAHGRKPCSEL